MWIGHHRDLKADVSSIMSSSEEIKHLWVVCGVYTESWSYAIGVHWNTKCIKNEILKFQMYVLIIFQVLKVHAGKVPTCKDKKQCNLWILQLEINFLYKSFVCDNIIMIES